MVAVLACRSAMVWAFVSEMTTALWSEKDSVQWKAPGSVHQKVAAMGEGSGEKKEERSELD